MTLCPSPFFLPRGSSRECASKQLLWILGEPSTSLRGASRAVSSRCIRGSYDDLIKAYAQFVEELHNMNYNVIGALYEEDMLNYLSETDFNYYLMRIEARIL